jgi:hypothetical protein
MVVTTAAKDEAPPASSRPSTLGGQHPRRRYHGFRRAGGLGQRIHVAISLFHEHQLMTLIVAIYAIVTLVDALSAWRRARLV